MNKSERINKIIAPLLSDGKPGTVIVPKSSRLLNPLSNALSSNNISLEYVARERRQYREKKILLTRPQDALTFMKIYGAQWAISTIDGIIEWAGEQGYASNRSFLEKYNVQLLGLVFCSVELTCRNDRKDLITRIEQAKTRSEVVQVLKNEDITIPTDVPYITRKLLPKIPLQKLRGGVEIACTPNYPVGVGVVESGATATEENLYRFTSSSPAILLNNSQLCLITNRKDNVYGN